MKLFAIIFLTFLLTNCGQSRPGETSAATNDEYKIILRTEVSALDADTVSGDHFTSRVPGAIDTATIAKLNEPLKALAAFYYAMGGSLCTGEYCELTTALGLGKQGSEKHQSLIVNYFPGDEVAEQVVAQDCYLRPSGASTFSDYEFLTVIDRGDSVFVNYRLMHYNRGEVTWLVGPDVYLFRDHTFENVKRNMWTDGNSGAN